jgi:hypothetical protein
MSSAEAVAMIMTVAISGALGTMWLTLHYRSKQAVKPKELAAIEARLAQIERAVDAIAVETERISEGQRFTSKLLGERSAIGSGS